MLYHVYVTAKLTKGYIPRYAYCIMDANSETITEQSQCDAHQTVPRMLIQACIESIESIQEPSDIIIHHSSLYLHESSRKLKIWKRDGWKNIAGNRPLENRDLWMRFDAAIHKHRSISIKRDAPAEILTYLSNPLGVQRDKNLQACVQTHRKLLRQRYHAAAQLHGYRC